MYSAGRRFLVSTVTLALAGAFLAACSSPATSPSPDPMTAPSATPQADAGSTVVPTPRDAGVSWDGAPSDASPAPADAASPPPVDAATSVGSNPQNPMNGYTPDQTFTLNSGKSDYYVSVPSSYDRSHKTPMALFVWLHGCGGQGYWDASMVSPGQSGKPQDWISLALGGRENDCWQPMNDIPWVLAAITDIETRFNVNTKRVVLGGYSSGGDLGYPTAFLHANLFAGILVENSDPFDNGYDANALLPAASWKLNVVHLAHLQDMTYPIDTVRSELATVKSAGFPVTVIERTGSHWDDAGATVDGQTVAGTAADLQTILLPYIDKGWTSP